jgi:hypothetical protein
VREKFDAQAAKSAFSRVFTTFIKLIPGKAWGLTAEKADSLGMPELIGD